MKVFNGNYKTISRNKDANMHCHECALNHVVTNAYWLVVKESNGFGMGACESHLKIVEKHLDKTLG